MNRQQKQTPGREHYAWPRLSLQRPTKRIHTRRRCRGLSAGQHVREPFSAHGCRGDTVVYIHKFRHRPCDAQMSKMQHINYLRNVGLSSLISNHRAIRILSPPATKKPVRSISLPPPRISPRTPPSSLAPVSPRHLPTTSTSSPTYQPLLLPFSTKRNTTHPPNPSSQGESMTRP